MKPKEILALTVGILFFIIDQTTKFIAVQEGSAQLNTGVALSVQLGPALPIILAIFFFGFMYWLWRSRSATVTTFVFGFAVFSNLVDRVHYGGVVDWLKVPGSVVINNLADWAIVLCLGWWFLCRVKKGARADIEKRNNG
ncbi:signal peptidase II [Candidatus Woesebacteria bacterium]|nr:signal peptidase II [Candidatus Woesebacteria bacterium]